MAPLLFSLRALSKSRPLGQGAVYSLHAPLLDVRRGEKILLTGPSGSGKSTLLDMLGMIARPDKAERFIFLPETAQEGIPASPAARDVAAAWSRGDSEALARWRRHVGYVPQTGGLLPFLPVRENILLPRKLLPPTNDPFFASLPDNVIQALGVGHLLHKLPAQLSVGERQRVAIARALAANPPLVLADEPTAALDPANAAAVLALFTSMADELGVALILATHAPEATEAMDFRRLRIRLEAAPANVRAVLEEQPAPRAPVLKAREQGQGQHALPDEIRASGKPRGRTGASPLALALWPALRDYWHERLLSACSILGLAAVLAPLMVLLGVHHGIIASMTERLLRDPRSLEITPVGSGSYGPDWFRKLEALPGVAFVMPQTRSIAATMNLRTSDGQQLVVPLTATGPGDPLLLRRNQSPPAWLAPEHAGTVPGEQQALPGVILSESAARKLKAAPGDSLRGSLDRLRAGRRETAGLSLRLLSVLPPEAQAGDMLYVPLELLVAAEDYRDGRAVPFLRWTGDPLPQQDRGKADAARDTSGVPDAGAAREASGVPDTDAAREVSGVPRHAPDFPDAETAAYARQIRASRQYASFRLYAASLDDVLPLWRFFQSRQVEVYVKTAEIESVRSLDRAFTIVFSLITGAAMAGFAASTASSALAGVKRKSRALGVMRLLGFSRGNILLFPVMQSLLTGLFGTLLAAGLYGLVALAIDSLFAASLPENSTICTLSPAAMAVVLGVVLLLSALSPLAAAWRAADVDPSEVIRDL